MTEIKVDFSKVLAIVKAQRNAAIDDVAVLQARVQDLEAEVAALKEKEKKE